MVITTQSELRCNEIIRSDFDVCGLVIGCVAENTPKYLSQALRLLQSVRWFGGKMADAKFIVCVVDEVDTAYKYEFQKYAAEVRIVERFSVKHPQSNKLRFLQLADCQDYQQVLLLDCDTIVVQDLSPHLMAEGFSAKIADGPTIPHQIFAKLFEYFHLAMPGEDYRCTVRGTPTIPYFNAGVLLFSHTTMADLVPAWVGLNEKLIKNLETLIPWSCNANFCEQASLSLALISVGTKFDVFDNNMNFPIHHANYFDSLENVDPLIIHYHSQINPSGYIKSSPYPLVNNRIVKFNDRLRQEKKECFDNKLFWNFRYTENPELGSGVGSRGESKDYKRNALKKLMDSINVETILDIGCGDMEISSILPSSGYIGVDLSSVVIERNRQLYPERTFVCGSFLELEIPSADLVVCMDVLIHLNDYNDYDRFVARLVEKTIRVGVVAGYETNPGCAGIVFYHEPLSETLMRMGVKELCRMGCYRDVDIWLFSKTSSCREMPEEIAPTITDS